jgi:hypothetical protein
MIRFAMRCIAFPTTPVPALGGNVGNTGLHEQGAARDQVRKAASRRAGV